MSYRWVEHTGEVELEIDGRTAESVFTEALRVLGQLVDDAGRGDAVRREIGLAGRELSALVVRWLDEIVYRAETEDVVPEDVERLDSPRPSIVGSVAERRDRMRGIVRPAVSLSHGRSDVYTRRAGDAACEQKHRRRGENSRSNGSSAEIASRGMTTSYQRGALATRVRIGREHQCGERPDSPLTCPGADCFKHQCRVRSCSRRRGSPTGTSNGSWQWSSTPVSPAA